MSEPKPLHYNLVWAQRTFSDRPTTEALLAPERELGNVSYNDYEAAARFSAGYHRFYPVISTALAIPLFTALRKPSWSTFRLCSFGLGALIGGRLSGQALKTLAHFDFVRSLEDPSGFAQAIENIQKKSGLPVPPGPTIIRPGSKWSAIPDSHPTTETSPTLPSTADIQQPSLLSIPSKWDQIRAANARASTNSSWDALRQNHERTRVPSVNSDSNPDTFQRSRNEDRAAEQARFNEMLERERNIKTS